MWPSWCHCQSLSLASVKSRLVLHFWYRLTWAVPDKGPLNVCVCVCYRRINNWWAFPLTCDTCTNDQWQRDFLRQILELHHFGSFPLLKQSHLLTSSLQRCTLLRKERRRTPTCAVSLTVTVTSWAQCNCNPAQWHTHDHLSTFSSQDHLAPVYWPFSKWTVVN